ncbi:MAG: beta-ketoacyl synthase N-terminal-like domain-containing protein, partial [Myxococcota bacterium]
MDHALASHPSVRTARTVLREDRPGDKRLVSYLVAAGTHVSTEELRTFLRAEIAEYVIPASFHWLDSLPKTSTGKLDTDALPPPNGERPSLAATYREPTNETERKLCESWSTLLGVSPVGIDDSFFDLGGNSLALMRLAGVLEKEHGFKLDPVTLLRHTTVRAQAQALKRPTRATVASQPRRSHDSGPIAIVGMAARFPGAANPREFWSNVLEGKETVRWFTPSELDPSIPDSEKSHSNYVAARGVLDNVDQFDAPFFGMSPLEARITDPQQRLMLELAWESLEDAGYAPGNLDARVGVYAGKLDPWYFQKNLLGHPDLLKKAGALQVRIGNEKDYVATRVAHRLNLRGPAISVHTACST